MKNKPGRKPLNRSKLNISVTSDTLDKLKALAKQTGRPIGYVVDDAMKGEAK